jgi:hypothetical protein
MQHPIFFSVAGDLIVAALALWRITHLLHNEEGPFGAMTRLRRAAGNGFAGRALDCFYCLSLWLSIPLALLIGADSLQRLLLWPALSGAACLLQRATQRPEHGGLIYEEPKE